MWINKFKVKEKYIPNQYSNDSDYFLCGWQIGIEFAFIEYHDKRKGHNNGTITIIYFNFINNFNKKIQYKIYDYNEDKEQRIYFICG